MIDDKALKRLDFIVIDAESLKGVSLQWMAGVGELMMLVDYDEADGGYLSSSVRKVGDLIQTLCCAIEDWADDAYYHGWEALDSRSEWKREREKIRIPVNQ